MINKQDHIRRQTCADLLLTDIVRLSLSDNTERIPFTCKGGYVSTELGENDDDEHIKLSIHGFMNETGMMMQTVTVIYFEPPEKAKAFLESPEGTGFIDTYSDGQDRLSAFLPQHCGEMPTS